MSIVNELPSAPPTARVLQSLVHSHGLKHGERLLNQKSEPGSHSRSVDNDDHSLLDIPAPLRRQQEHLCTSEDT
jgi:hypothetical protein